MFVKSGARGSPQERPASLDSPLKDAHQVSRKQLKSTSHSNEKHSGFFACDMALRNRQKRGAKFPPTSTSVLSPSLQFQVSSSTFLNGTAPSKLPSRPRDFGIHRRRHRCRPQHRPASGCGRGAGDSMPREARHRTRHNIGSSPSASMPFSRCTPIGGRRRGGGSELKVRAAITASRLRRAR